MSIITRLTQTLLGLKPSQALGHESHSQPGSTCGPILLAPMHNVDVVQNGGIDISKGFFLALLTQQALAVAPLMASLLL